MNNPMADAAKSLLNGCEHAGKTIAETQEVLSLIGYKLQPVPLVEPAPVKEETTDIYQLSFDANIEDEVIDVEEFSRTDRSRRAWSRQDRAVLIEMTKQGKSDRVIGERLGRTAKAVASYRQSLDTVPNKRRPWPKQDIDELVRLHNTGHTNEEIAEMINRTPGSVKSRLYILRNETNPRI